MNNNNKCSISDKEAQNASIQQLPAGSIGDLCQLTQQTNQKLLQYISQDELKSFNKWLDQLNARTIPLDQIYRLAICNEKQKRKQVHQLISNQLPMFESHTTQVKQQNSNKYIEIILKQSLSNKKRRKLDFRHSKNEGGDYLQLILYKVNVDTNQAISRLIKATRKQSKSFSFAGTKDKRGVTSQRVSIWNGNQAVMEQIVKNKSWKPGIKIGNFTRRPDHIRLGQLKGNNFKIVLRFIQSSQDQDIINCNILKSNKNLLECENVKQNGFINYFGMQRFGGANYRTHQIGLQVIKKNWKRVAEMILGQYIPGWSTPDIIKVKKEMVKLLIEDQNINGAMKLLKFNMRQQKSFLTGIKNSGNAKDYLSGFLKLPRTTKMMFGHALQSFIWNWAVSRRVELYGFQIFEGDIVRKFSSNQLNLQDDEEQKKEPVQEDAQQNDQNNVDIFDKVRDVKILTQEELKNFTIFDILFPVIGYGSILPENKTKAIFDQIMDALELNLDMFNLKTGSDLSTKGSYRNLIVKPDNYKYNIIQHDEKDEDLQMIDPTNQHFGQSVFEAYQRPQGSKYKSLKLDFDLPSSSYATMLIREITRQLTSVNSQKQS